MNMMVQISASDRDNVALHIGRILQSCSMVEHALFRMISARQDIEAFKTIERAKFSALRNLIAKILPVLEAAQASKSPQFKNPKTLKEALSKFDTAAAKRSALAHSEFITTCQIEGRTVAILSNEGVEGTIWAGRTVQLLCMQDLSDTDKLTHQLANSLKQMIENQITLEVGP